MRSFFRFGAVSLACVVAATTAVDAGAFCRTTTCVGDCPRDEDGCKTTGKKIAWPSSCVGVSLQKDSSVHIPMKYFEQVAQRSFVAWTDLECETGTATIAFSQLDDVACNRTEYNTDGTNANVILFQDTKWEYTGVDNNLAKTTVTFDDESGEILDADIEINHANNNFTISDTNVDYDLESVLTHEIGHLIGIDHTPDFTATMYAGYEPGTIEGRTLEEDDVLAACAAYSPIRRAQFICEPNGGLGMECGGVDPGDEDGADGGTCACSVVGGEPNGRVPSPLTGLALVAAAWLWTRRRKDGRVRA